MRNKYIMLQVISLALSISFFGCSGGGGGSSSPPQPPLIQALLFSFPTGSVPPAQFANALASVTDSSTGANITTASVTMNGAPLIYNGAPTHQEYEGNVTVMPGGSVTLSVTVGDKTYTASGTQFTTYPTISSPVPGATFTTSSSNTVAWSAGAPLTNNAVYLLGVLDAIDPNGGTAYFAPGQGTNVNSFSIPAFSLTAGSRVVIVGIMTPVSIPNAAANSALVFGGFNYVPITVMQWTARTFGGGVLGSVIWSGTQFVAVGLMEFNGIIFTSPNGVTWTSRTASNASSLFGVTWSGTQFVAVGDNGTTFTSPDGVTWTTRTSGTVNSLYGVTRSETQFVAVGLGGTILTSPDGVTWTQRTSGSGSRLSGVTWSGTQFVAVGDGGAILTSPDGMTWTTRTSGIFNPLYSITWSGTKFIAVGYGGGILTSIDGVTWTTLTSGTVFNLYGVTWSGTQFVAVGDSTILTSP